MKRRNDSFGSRNAVLDTFKIFTENDELVAAQTGNGVGVSNGSLDSSGDLHEDGVALGVSEGVVDGLESIEIDIQHAAHVMVPTSASKCLIESVEQHCAVW